MGMSGEKAQNSQANTLLGTTNTAIDTASTENPATKQVHDYWQSIMDWDTGKLMGPDGKAKPVDIHDLPGSGADIALFEDAKAQRDAGRVGRGLGTVGDKVNPGFLAALDKELENERDIQASGRLEDTVQGKVAEARAGLTGIGTQTDARNQNVAGLRANLYGTYLNRPRDPSLFAQLLQGGLAAGGQLGSAAIMAGAM